jgi:hypothetical protein
VQSEADAVVGGQLMPDRAVWLKPTAD